MINDLKRKIFWIIQISLSVIILGVVLMFGVFSYRNTLKSTIMLMEKLSQNEYFKIDNENSNSDFYFIKIEGIYKLEIYNNMILKASNNVTTEIMDYANFAINKASNEGYVGNYIYKIRKLNNDVFEITLMENKDTVKRLKTIVFLEYTIGIAGLIVVYIIAKKISKTIVKPVENSFEMQKQFISDASHELKTPLAVIEANSDVLQDKIGENKWITYIQKEVQSMNKLVNDLLTLAKTENKEKINKQDFNLSKEIEISVAVFESMMFEKEINLESNIVPDIHFYGDKEDIKHIVSIIIDNAIKHTEKGNKIIVNLNKEGSFVEIEIKNQGNPIPVEEQEKIFERFYRVDKSRNRSEKRYGLGLAIAKSLVENYNGSIKASSNNGFTSFVVRFNSK